MFKREQLRINALVRKSESIHIKERENGRERPKVLLVVKNDMFVKK